MTGTPNMRAVGSSLAPADCALPHNVAPRAQCDDWETRRPVLVAMLNDAEQPVVRADDTWEGRLAGELTQMQTRVTRLEAFMESGRMQALDPLDCDLLRAQWGAMCAYVNVLRIRAQRAGLL